MFLIVRSVIGQYIEKQKKTVLSKKFSKKGIVIVQYIENKTELSNYILEKKLLSKYKTSCYGSVEYIFIEQVFSRKLCHRRSFPSIFFFIENPVLSI